MFGPSLSMDLTLVNFFWHGISEDLPNFGVTVYSNIWNLLVLS